MHPACAGLAEHRKLSKPAARARKENIKPTNDANDPQKGFPFLEMLRERVSAAAGGDTPQRVLAPREEHRGLEKHGGAARGQSPPGNRWEPLRNPGDAL